ncbi:putative nuclease HARBI1 [Ixodes scapularis]
MNSQRTDRRDSGYPLEPWLITPVPGNHATSTACGRFNKAHSSIRSVVERCIGLLKNRFRCLQRHRALYYHPSTATAIISACAVLHNICLASSKPEPESDSDPEESELESEPSSEGPALGPERLAPAGLPVGLSDRGRALRQHLVARFGTRRRRARAERHTQGVRRHDGGPEHQGHRRKPLSALATVVPSMDAAGDGKPLATTTEVLTTKDPISILALSEALPVEAVTMTCGAFCSTVMAVHKLRTLFQHYLCEVRRTASVLPPDTCRVHRGDMDTAFPFYEQKA